MGKGIFTGSLAALQLHIRSLLDGVGGEDTAQLLDMIATLEESEQKIVVSAFLSVMQRILTGEERLMTADDAASKKFVDNLFDEIIGVFRSKHLSVVNGGPAKNSKLVDMSAARQKKRVKEYSRQ